MDYTNKKAIDFVKLTKRIGTHTKGVLQFYSTSKCMPYDKAKNYLAQEIVPFQIRLTKYLSKHFGVEEDIKHVRACLTQQSDKKGLCISSAIMSQWFDAQKGEIYISPLSIFKLCLAMDLDIEESASFVYDCLYQNWFNYRNIEECIYFFYLGTQELFGNSTYNRAVGMVEEMKALLAEEHKDTGDAHSAQHKDATGYTQMLGIGIRSLFETQSSSTDELETAFRTFLHDNKKLFTGIQRSARRTYDIYFSTGGVDLEPLSALYFKATGYKLPKSSYLDMSSAGVDIKAKRLLWGALHRSEWIKNNSKDWDILNEHEIRIEHHAVKRMLKGNITRGNIIALLFFHFCFEHDEALKTSQSHEELFKRFYSVVNTTLIDECGMMPLHPRKPLDRLFLISIAFSSSQNPIDFMNNILKKYYKS